MHFYSVMVTLICTCLRGLPLYSTTILQLEKIYTILEIGINSLKVHGDNVI